jgi:hypothetical protein
MLAIPWLDARPNGIAPKQSQRLYLPFGKNGDNLSE